MPDAGFEIATTVFDGWENIPIQWPVPLFIDGAFVQCGPDKAVALKCNAKIDEEKTLPSPPPESCYWNVEHGCTGWMRNPVATHFFGNTVYAVPVEWYENWKGTMSEDEPIHMGDTDAYADHEYCTVCRECITCGLRPCRDGKAHTRDGD
jgi:hypothetical protein